MFNISSPAIIKPWKNLLVYVMVGDFDVNIMNTFDLLPLTLKKCVF